MCLFYVNQHTERDIACVRATFEYVNKNLNV